jgi:lycopene cyclase domain-containing protein
MDCSGGALMTYTDFLLLFLVLPFIVLMIFLRRRLLDRRYLVFTGVLLLVALAYMAPWDHIAAVWGLWTWSKGQTWALRWWAIPPEEYLFCLLEALLAITLTYALLSRKARKGEAGTVQSRQWPESTHPWRSQDERGSIATRVSRRDHLEVQVEESNQEEKL